MGDEALLEALPHLGSEFLDPKKNYWWSGILVARKIVKPARRVILGGYSEWFQWYMRTQRVRAFHTIVLLEPLTAVSDGQIGGYIDGLLARLMGKVSQVVVAAKRGGGGGPLQSVSADETHVDSVLRALLYGTRLSRPELLEAAGRTLIPIPEQMLEKALRNHRWRISKTHPRLQLDEFDEELLEMMITRAPRHHHEEEEEGEEEQQQTQRFFERKKRFKQLLAIPDEMLREKILEDIGKRDWVTAPYAARKASEWLEGLNKAQDSRLARIYWKHEDDATHEQWLRLLSPSKGQIRRILDGLVADGRVESRRWFREVGRPALAYVLPGKSPFLDQRCGQCAFYVSVRRRCRLWWLVNKKRVFFHPRWREAGSPVSAFEIHKMQYASRIGPHSSACERFIDKKRDHLRKTIPAQCEICGEAIRGDGVVAVACQNCRTKYVRFRDRVKVMTAYEHEYYRLYHAITGSDAKADLEVWKREMRARLPLILEERRMKEQEEDDLDVLAEEPEFEEEPPRAWPVFDQALQEKVDRLTQSSDITKWLSVAMVQNALNSTRRIIVKAKLYSGDVALAISLLEKYLTLINDPSSTKFVTFEALAMKQYWFCFGLAIKKAQQWFGPRKKSRFVREFVEDPTGRARGYSAVDASINYLHQRRLRQAERINAEVGFQGTCDGFLHRESYNSRRIGLLLDMIDPFKFPDREALLALILNGGLSWRDFKLETDRRGLTFYHPSGTAKTKLDQAGAEADNSIVKYQGNEMRLSEAYRQFATSLFQELTSLDAESPRSNRLRFEIPVALKLYHPEYNEAG
jgi:CRISPR/Cas system-associated endonuclease Cas1